jgi:hypothetical protein
MISSVNTLDCWFFEENEWIFFVVCSPCIGLLVETCLVSLGFLVWFSVENNDYGFTKL